MLCFVIEGLQLDPFPRDVQGRLAVAGQGVQRLPPCLAVQPGEACALLVGPGLEGVGARQARAFQERAGVKLEGLVGVLSRHGPFEGHGVARDVLGDADPITFDGGPVIAQETTQLVERLVERMSGTVLGPVGPEQAQQSVP